MDEAKVCVLGSGSSGNSIFVEAGNCKLLIDAGFSGIRITRALKEIDVDPLEIEGILITHEHSDHIHGAGILSRRYGLPIYASEKTWEAIAPYIGEVDPKNQKVFNKDHDFEIKELKIEPFDIPHDAVEPVGYSIYHKEKKLTFVTDIGHINKDLANKVDGSDLILLESNHDVEMLKIGPYPWPLKKRVLSEKGHLSNDDAGKMAVWLARNKSIHILLGHLSAQNNFPELAYKTVASMLEEKGININKDVKLDIALRDVRSDIFYV